MSNATEKVTAQLRKRILSGEWTPGTKLQSATLAGDLGSSSTVVREALTRLSGGALVTLIPNRGFFVKELNLTELRDVTELRVRTEGLAVELAIARGGLEWESEVVAAWHRLSRVPRRSSTDENKVSEEWQRLHKEFHLQVFKACGCQPIMELASNLFDATEFYRCWVARLVSPGARDVEGEHRRIVDAIVARDAAEASAAIRDHYEATVKVIIDAGVRV